ncbi:MAG TPA: redoxin domain-containing protein [Anaerolineales bacterium]|nr:redoxin domain-containing protein [Anaerolineales bacterium]
MKRFLFALLAFALVGCASQQNEIPMTGSPTSKPAPLPDLGPAPELTNETWLNVDAPLRLADLSGKVVIVEMWTFGCINCQHVIPSLKDWHAKYKDQGLVIIGNHYPEFSYEQDLDNLKEAIAREDIQYAVAQDNDGATWKAYKNRYWPALYLIDKQGHIRYVHFGEGRYQETEENIKALLEE